MKLSELVNYRCQLDAMFADPIGQTADKEIEKIIYLTKNQNIQIANFAQQLHQRRIDIQKSFDLFEGELTALKLELKHLIEVTEKPWFTESYRLYDQEMQNETVEDIKNRTVTNISEDTKNFYLARISKYNSWKHAAIAIRPGFESYLDHMVGCDPLYVVDVKHELLLPALSRYNEIYQQRLRPYVVSEREQPEILHSLPNEQFGFIFAYNFFNFRPFEIIRRYLEEAYKKLQPGGIMVMTFNDCDRDKAVMLVEQHFCCYTPGYLILELAKNIGFEPVLNWNDGGPSTWLELKKPGEFTSLRGGQALAKILPKPVAESK
jgi:SAM-dependent methyltransferase